MSAAKWYAVRVLDSDGCELSGNHETCGKANAIAAAKCYLTDPEYAPHVARLEVCDSFTQAIVWDWNAPEEVT